MLEPGAGQFKWKRENRFPWRCVLGFMSALFGGKDVNLNNLISQYGQIGGQQTGQGQKHENQAGDFFSSLVSGDAGKISQTLAPEISAAKTRNSETKNQMPRWERAQVALPLPMRQVAINFIQTSQT